MRRLSAMPGVTLGVATGGRGRAAAAALVVAAASASPVVGGVSSLAVAHRRRRGTALAAAAVPRIAAAVSSPAHGRPGWPAHSALRRRLDRVHEPLEVEVRWKAAGDAGGRRRSPAGWSPHPRITAPVSAVVAVAAAVAAAAADARGRGQRAEVTPAAL